MKAISWASLLLLSVLPLSVLPLACGGGSAGPSSGAAGTHAGGKTGTAGTTGGAGSTGTAGVTGGAGTTGTAGTTGGAGTTGNAGTTGGAGTTGTAGTTGGAGTTGAAGTTGGAGTTGAAGTTGGAGTTGAAGTTGTAGTAGNDAATNPDSGNADAGADATPDVSQDGPGFGIITGGGVGGVAIAGTMYVHVIDDFNNAPIAGATVTVGEAGALRDTKTTDASGRAVLTNAAMTGPQAVTADVPGEGVTTWFGVAGNEVTISIRTKAVRKGNLHGTIAGFTALTPAFGHYFVAYAAPSAPRDLSSPDVDSGSFPTTPNCINAPLAGMISCDFTVPARAGDIGVLATIFDVDSKLTQSTSDDTMVAYGFAYALTVHVTAGATTSLVTLTQLIPTPIPTMSITVAPPTAGTPVSGAVAGVDMGALGLFFVVYPAGFVASGGTAAVPVPPLTGPFAGATYVAIAKSGYTTPVSAKFLGGIASAATGATFGAYLPLCTQAAMTAMTTIGYTPVPGAVGHILRYTGTGSGNVPAWTISPLDGRTSLVMPLAGRTLAGTATGGIQVEASNAPLNPASFTAAGLVAGTTAASRDVLSN